jgi:hypothetical protein
LKGGFDIVRRDALRARQKFQPPEIGILSNYQFRPSLAGGIRLKRVAGSLCNASSQVTA